MACCGKKLVQKVGAIAKGNAMYMGYTMGVLPKEKYVYRNSRLRVCRQCDEHIYILKKLFCKKCKCWLPAKTFVKEEQCPKGYWNG